MRAFHCVAVAGLLGLILGGPVRAQDGTCAGIDLGQEANLHGFIHP